MKTKRLLLAALIGGLVSTVSHAQTALELDVTGGQTFKSAVINRAYQIFDGGAASTSSNVADSNHISLEGTASGVLGGNTTNVIVRLGFTSTEQGILDLAQANQVGFARTLAEGGGTALISNIANVSFSDIFPGSVVPPQNVALFHEQVIGVVPFAFVGHSDLVFSNLTREQAISFYEFSGELTENFFTTNGSPSKTIYYFGRSNTAGARIVPEIDLAYVGSPQIYGFVGGQYTPTSGYTTASSLVSAIASTPATLGTAGIADFLAGPSPNADDFILTVEGYYPSPTNVALGYYPIWSYDHAYTIRSGTNALNSLQEELFTNLVAQLTNEVFQTSNAVYTNSFVALTHMQVNRLGDGTVIIPGGGWPASN